MKVEDFSSENWNLQPVLFPQGLEDNESWQPLSAAADVRVGYTLSLKLGDPAQSGSCKAGRGLAKAEHLRKRAAVASGPKFREETPKKGCNPATPIAVLHCTI